MLRIVTSLECCLSVLLIFLCMVYFLAVKAKAVGEIIKNRPPAGVLDTALATEYKVILLKELHASIN